MVDNLIHQIDECCWLMDSWPVACHGMGGREVGSDDHGQNIDTYSMEFTFPNGKKAFCGFRRAAKGRTNLPRSSTAAKRRDNSRGMFTKPPCICSKIFARTRTTSSGHRRRTLDSPWDYEWIDFIASIRADRPYNEAKRAVYADYASLMGRAAAHLNRTVTWEEITNSEFQFCDNLDDLTMDSTPPVLADAEGFFPAPAAGVWNEL